MKVLKCNFVATLVIFLKESKFFLLTSHNKNLKNPVHCQALAKIFKKLDKFHWLMKVEQTETKTRQCVEVVSVGWFFQCTCTFRCRYAIPLTLIWIKAVHKLQHLFVWRTTHSEEVRAAFRLLADRCWRVGGLRDVDTKLLLAGAGCGRDRRRIVT